MADAIAELILEPEKGKARGTALMVVEFVAHHVQFWSDGGPTDFGNLAEQG